MLKCRAIGFVLLCVSMFYYYGLLRCAVMWLGTMSSSSFIFVLRVVAIRRVWVVGLFSLFEMCAGSTMLYLCVLFGTVCSDGEQ